MTSHRITSRLLPTVVTLALAPGSLLVLALVPSAAAPLPAAYSAAAHADIIDLTADLLAPLAPGSIAQAKIGHSRSSVTSAPGVGTSTATSSNLDGSALFGNVPLAVDTETVTAPPTADPAPRVLLNVPVPPIADIGVITGDVQAAWAGSNSCVPAQEGVRTLSQSRTTLANATLVSDPRIGALVEATASQTQTGTYLVDDSVGGSDVLSQATTTVGDIDLLGGEVTVDVAHPVVLEARSDGTTGTAGYASPPSIVASVGGTPIPIPLNSQPQSIALPTELEPVVNLTITAFTPTAQSSGATGKGTLDALFRIDLEVLALAAPAPAVKVADISLGVAPMAAEATAPSGGVECFEGPSSGSLVPPDITSPVQGATVTDSTPPISGTGQPGATVTVREGGTVLCRAVVRRDGTWSCSPTTPLSAGSHTVTATQTDGSGGTSASDSTTFTVVPDPNDPDGDGLRNGQETTHGTDPLDPDTDNDGLTDGQEVKGSKIRERFEVCGKKARKSIKVTTNPLVKDTDKDGLTDGREVKGYTIKQRVVLRDKTIVISKTRTNPRKKDTDRDGLKDKVEKTGRANKRFGKAKSDPTKCDTDRGGISDGKEVRARSNPINVFSGPRMPGERSGRMSVTDLPSGLG